MAAHAMAAEESLVVNAGFEEAGANGLPAYWSGPADVFQRDTAVVRNGEATLKFVNDRADHYALCGQDVHLEIGRMYEISAWVKTAGVEGDDSGATICVEWSDAEGKYLGGCYPSGIKGEQDWTLIQGTTGRVPEKAAYIGIKCYLRQGMIGTAWWDDVSIALFREDPLRTVLVTPNYRAEVADEGPKKAVIRAHLNLADYNVGLEDVALRWRALGEGSEDVIDAGGQERLRKESVDLAVPVSKWAPGEYTVQVVLVAKASGETLSTKCERIRRVGHLPQRKVYIDKHNRVIVDGQPFFPLGMYWGSVNAEELETYADSAFNCLMPYGGADEATMDLCQAKGLKLIYSVKDYYAGTHYCPKEIQTEAHEINKISDKVEAFRNHPALLAWYINDELPLDMVDRLAARQQQMEALDPDHPTWVVLYQVDQVGGYLPTFDAIGTDPYPIPSQPAAMAGEWTRKTRAAVEGARPVWQVPQVFNWACYRKDEKEKAACRPPTFDEMRSMIWQCIAEGANGIVCYSWFDIRRDEARAFDETWPLLKEIAGEVADLIPVLLSVEKAPAISADEADGLSWMAKRHGDAVYLFVVNGADEARTARFSLPSPAQAATDVATDAPVEGLSPRRFHVELEPLGVRVLRLTGL